MEVIQHLTRVELYGILLVTAGLMGRYLFDRFRRKGKLVLLLFVLEMPFKLACKAALLLGILLLIVEGFNKS